MAKPDKNTDRMKALLNSVTDDMVNSGMAQHFQDNSVKVERFILDLIRPDPIQPRRVLPDEVHYAFHNERLTPAQALREMVRMAQVAARQRGRPFGHVLELLADADEEEANGKLSPEEVILRDLINLAVTISSDGQVNPLTVVEMTSGVTRLYRIETGERRYWATWLLRDFMPEYKSDGLIPCIVVPAESTSVFRQARENTARSGLSAIAMARQAALLLLTVHGYELPVTAVSNDFYRQALDLDLRGKREYTGDILAAMGGISKVHFSRYKALLALSDDAMEIADRHNVEEKKLRYVVPLEPQFHGEVLRQIVDFNLSGNQVKELCEMNNDHELNEEQKSVPDVSARAFRLARLARMGSDASAEEFAQALIYQEKSIGLARGRLQALREIIDRTEQLLLDE